MDFVTVASFDTSPEAHIAMGRLLAEGLDAHLADEHLVQTDWLYSIAVGGIKLQVPPQAEQARRILARDDSDQIDAEN
ncbi:hypothetical protein Tel_14940 [Candidatus Tenderia electrophaga]|jgi:hypothetical protein|uniref:DUF2007 domain-containing protein n=1 Tax=Candidatus Tenderia electrophaga TaxID=1748243 RepID=A0A0S2TGT1_9GAMM|nr:hypothetical protein Tel_14940 [Candidatus Tenderia electrophaga]